jgi:hypothetical protein
MGFKHTCFISYCHGQYDLVKSFIEQLSRAFRIYLERHMDIDDNSMYIDEERLKPGYKYNEALAQAICESLCMIVVYSPRYEHHPYCLREFTAMERIEEKRKALLGPKGNGKGFIIPIILGGEGDLPPKIKNSIHYYNFSKFTLASTEIRRNKDFIPDIERICLVIHELCRALAPLHQTLEDIDCTSFQLPGKHEIPPWRPGGAPPSPLPFPSREPMP